MKFNTALLHGDFRGDKATGATLTPVYQSSAFEHESAEELEKIFNNRAPGFSYTRISNPTIDAFEKRMTALEGGVASVACASGMAALTRSAIYSVPVMRLYQVPVFMVAALIYSGIWKASELRQDMLKITILRNSGLQPMNIQDFILRRQ